MSALTPYLIGELKTGISTYLQPWQRPSDAFDPLENAYVYRGVLQKRNGSIPFGNQLADMNPVMGIMQWQNETTGLTKLVVATTRNAYVYNGTTFTLLNTVSDSVFWKGTATGTITVPTFWPNISHTAPGTVSITDGTTTITDDGAGNFTSGGIFAAGGTINYTTGVVTLNFTGTTPGVSLSISLTLLGNYFSGNNTNFFNWTNWQPTDPATLVSSVSYLYMTNNVDPVTLYDGTNLSRPIFYTNSAMTEYVTKTLDVAVYKNRLLFIRPFLNISTNSLNQTILYSALFNPFNFINDVAGNGGLLTAATGDIIQSIEFLRDSVIVMFSNSTWIFRYTGFDIDPYRFDKINNSKTNQVPYGTTPYDERVTSLGSNGFIACDGANVQRYDIPIIDYYETEISEFYYGQCFSQRYDNLNQQWMFYVSTESTNPVVGGGAPGADKATIYNFLENNWATYTFSIPMTCLGLYSAQEGTTWATAGFTWEDSEGTWTSYTQQKSAPILLAGDVNGNVYWMDNSDAVSDGQFQVTGEVIAVGSGTNLYNGTVASPPLLSGSFSATDGTESFTDEGNGQLLGNMGGSGNINYTTGVWQLQFAANVPMATNITAHYIHGHVILPFITTTRWNPIIQVGQKVQFTYLDVYYSISSTDPVNPIQLTLSFFADNSENSAVIRTLTLDGPVNSANTFKRIYFNIVGEFLQMNIDPSENAVFKILGFILWAKPAGRLTP